MAVTTNTVRGYSLSVYTQDSSNSMRHQNSSVTDAIAPISSISGYNATTGASDLAGNTWGFRKNNGTTDSPSYTNWFAVGENANNNTIIYDTDTGNAAYCENLSYPLNNTDCDAGSYDTHSVNFGAKLTSSLPAGTYTNNVVFSAVAKDEGARYTLDFHPNGGENVMAKRAIIKGSTTTLPRTGFVMSGYYIKGWALTQADAEAASVTASHPTATTPSSLTYRAGKTVEVNDLIIAAIAAGQSVEQNALINLYAIWEPDADPIQGFMCRNLSAGESTALKDTRDGQKYTVKKLADGNCWMMDNLAVSDVLMTDQDTNLATNATFDLTTGVTYSGSTGWCQENSDACDNVKAVYVDNTNGGYYNWYTATAGNGTYSTSTDGTTIVYDICPKGWHLPVGGNNSTTNQFARLDIALNPQDSLAGTNRHNDTSGIDATALATSFANLTSIFPLVGRIDGSLVVVGTRGYYQSSTARSDTSSYFLDLQSGNSYVAPRSHSVKYTGLSIRCVAQNHYTLAYDANSGTGTAPASQPVSDNESVTLQNNTFEKDGYNFLGWSTNASATTADYPASSSQNVNDIVAAASASGQTPTDGSTLTLYAVWEKAVTYFQTTGSCATIDVNTTGTLTDSRDEQEYTVYRFRNTGTAGNFDSGYPSGMSGYCIMTKDLSLGYVTGGSVTKGSDLTLTTNDSAAAATITARTDTSDRTRPDYWSASDSSPQYINGYGRSYYSFVAAQKVCPKGWTLPTQTQYNNIASFMGGNSSTGSSHVRNAPYGFVLGGRFEATIEWSNVGSFGYYWSSTESGSDRGYGLYFGSSNLFTSSSESGNYKNRGMSVRCVSAP